MNRVTLIGRVVNSVEVTRTRKPVTGEISVKATIAMSVKITPPSYPTPQYNIFCVMAYGKTAVYVSESIKKGDTIICHGSLRVMDDGRVQVWANSVDHLPPLYLEKKK